jgi:hypothetical protein
MGVTRLEDQLTMHLFLRWSIAAEALERPTRKVRWCDGSREAEKRPRRLLPELTTSSSLHGQIGSRRRAGEGVAGEFRLGPLAFEAHCVVD